MSAGHLIEFVKFSLEGKGLIFFYGFPGCVITTPVDLFRIISRHYYQAQRGKKS
jgi:hypothetical protein